MTSVLEAVRRATPEDLLAAETGTDLSYELVDGELREKLMGMPANRVGAMVPPKRSDCRNALILCASCTSSWFPAAML